jgi:hypothetical protein
LGDPEQVQWLVAVADVMAVGGGDVWDADEA